MTPDMNDLFKEETWPKVCSCGHKMSDDDWERMRYIGIQKGFDDIPDLELRSCNKCGSTLAITVPRDFVDV